MDKFIIGMDMYPWGHSGDLYWNDTSKEWKVDQVNATQFDTTEDAEAVKSSDKMKIITVVS